MKLTATLAALAMSVASLSAVPLSPETILLCQGPNAGTISACETFQGPYPTKKVWRISWHRSYTFYHAVNVNVGLTDSLGMNWGYLEYKGLVESPKGGTRVFFPKTGNVFDGTNDSGIPEYLTSTRVPDGQGAVTLWNAWANFWAQGTISNVWSVASGILDILRKLWS